MLSYDELKERLELLAKTPGATGDMLVNGETVEGWDQARALVNEFVQDCTPSEPIPPEDCASGLLLVECLYSATVPPGEKFIDTVGKSAWDTASLPVRGAIAVRSALMDYRLNIWPQQCPAWTGYVEKIKPIVVGREQRDFAAGLKDLKTATQT